MNFRENTVRIRCCNVSLSNFPDSLGGTVEWLNPYRHTKISEGGISLATMLDGIATAVREDTQLIWTGEMGRADQEMVIASTPLCPNRIGNRFNFRFTPDPDEEAAFDRNFVEQFGVHPREDIEKALQVNFKAR